MEEIRLVKVMIDLNILLDVFLARRPWLADAQAVWDHHNKGIITGHVAAHALTNLFYISRRSIGIEAARKVVRSCLQTFAIVPVGRAELIQADLLAGSDLEDNLVLACAIRADLDAIVTRDPRGFPDSPVPVLGPAEFLARLTAEM